MWIQLGPVSTGELATVGQMDRVIILSERLGGGICDIECARRHAEWAAGLVGKIAIVDVEKVRAPVAHTDGADIFRRGRTV